MQVSKLYDVSLYVHIRVSACEQSINTCYFPRTGLQVGHYSHASIFHSLCLGSFMPPKVMRPAQSSALLASTTSLHERSFAYETPTHRLGMREQQTQNLARAGSLPGLRRDPAGIREEGRGAAEPPPSLQTCRFHVRVLLSYQQPTLQKFTTILNDSQTNTVVFSEHMKCRLMK